ncbi:MAG: hypothetical protein WCQ95_09910 [Bacteroidota bacterium]
MAILFLCFAIVAVLSGFIGLVILVKGFVDKNNKKIQLGTILVSVMLVLATTGAFCIARRALDSKRYHEQKREMRMEKCMKDCDFDGVEMMKGGCMGGDNMKMCDTTGMKVITKVMVDKKCCMKDAPKTCPSQKK